MVKTGPESKQRSLLQFFAPSAAPSLKATQPDASPPKVFPSHDSAADQQLPMGETQPPSTHAAAPEPAEGADGELPSADAECSSPDEENVGPNAYEQERLERICRNQEKMRSLGLGPGGFAMLPGPTPKPRPAVRKKRPPPGAATAPGCVRRSARHKPGGGGDSGRGPDPQGGHAAPRQAEAAAELLHYDDSSVQRYVCDVLADGRGAARRDPAGHAARVAGFARVPGLLRDAALARAYSVDWRPGLVAAGGKDGQVSLWGSQALEEGALGGDGGAAGLEVAPLLSHRLHRGWLSDVQFCSTSASPGGPGSGGGAVRLLTAGNDGCVCLWDATKSAARGRQELPLCLAKAGDIHSGGIFSMHEAAQRVLTASKDCSVAVSAVREGGALCVVQRYSALHDGVVKCARWRAPGGGGAASAASSPAAAVVFASCGNDRTVRVVDTRRGGPASGGATSAAVALQGGHSTAVNCVRWSPASEHLLLSASHDPHILVHDLRAPGQALHALLGHSQERRVNAIYQPAFVGGGKGVAAGGGGERGGTLSLYCTATGAAVSRGAVDFGIGATFCGGGAGDPLLCTASRGVALFVPRWEELSVD